MESAISIDQLSISNDQFRALVPYLVICLGAFFAVIASVIRGISSMWAVFGVCSAALVFTAVSTWQLITDFRAGDFNVGENVVTLFSGMMVSDLYSNVFNLVFLFSALITMLISVRYLQQEKLDLPEYHLLIIFSVIGMMLMTSAADFIVIFIALEIMSLSIYSLVGFRRSDKKANEASLKYFILGGVASAIFLYGAALIYGTTASTRLSALYDVATQGQGQLSFVIGCWLVTAGFLFKVASVPFHMWMPDVYEGSPAPITGFMTTGLKVASFATFLRIFLSFGYGYEAANEITQAGNVIIQNMRTQFTQVLWVTAVLTMVVGNFAALLQNNLKRMLAYSSIAHTGYLLVGMVAATHSDFGTQAVSSLMSYLIAYTVMNLGAFAVITLLAQKNDGGLNLQHLSGLARKHPALSVALALFMFSMAGIPPTVGFLGKYMLFYSAVQAGEIPLVVISVICSVVSVYYYLRVMVYLYMRDPAQDTSLPQFSAWSVVAVSLLAFMTLQLGLMPSRIIELTQSAANNLIF